MIDFLLHLPARKTTPGLALLMLLFMSATSLLTASPVSAQDLTAEQTQKFNAVTSGLNRVKTNLQLALDSAGPGTGVPSGSKAKLSKMRLDSAAVDMPQLKQWLSELPADAAPVQTLAADFASVEQAIAGLDARLAGKTAAPPAAPPAATVAEPAAAAPAATPATPATASAPAAAAPPAEAAVPAEPETPATVKMGYQQEDQLKAARFNLREVQGYATALTQLVAELQPQPEQMKIDHRKVRTGMNTIDTARRKAGFVQDGLSQLPPNGQGVADTAAELATANEQIDSAETYLAPLHQQLTQLIDPANYPQYQDDLKRLTELGAMYANAGLLQTDRPQAAAVLAEAEAARAEAIRIAQAYLPLMDQQTDEGKRIEGAGNNFLSKQQAFLTAAEQERQALSGQIRADLAAADGIANEAVAGKKPLFFTGGIPQRMAEAEDKLALFVALDPQQAAAVEQEMNAMKASLRQREQSLGELIIQQNPLPSDRYTGADRDKVVAVAVDAWKHQQDVFTVLASRIPSEAWARETMWQYSNGTWYYVDRSKLQVQLVVADEDNEELAIIRPVNIWMNHQKGDTLIGTPLYGGDDELQPSDYLLRDKIN